MSDYDEEYEELTSAQRINEKKSRMAEYALGILPRKVDVSGFIPQDRHTMEFFENSDGSVSHSIVKRPRK
jgi:hypothetical protein